MKRRALLLPLTLMLALPVPAVAADKRACVSAAQDAQRLRASDQLLEAKRELITCAQDTCPDVVRSDCSTWLGEVERGIPTLVVRARDERDQEVEGRLSIDGVPVAAGLDGRPIEVNPGKHAIRFVPSEGAAIEESVVAAAGEKNRIVTLRVRRSTTEALAPPPRSGERAPEPAADASPMPWILVGVGAAGLATFGVFQLLARSDRAEIEDGCGKTRSCEDDELAPAKTKFLISGVGLVVGVIGVGAGLTWLVLDDERGRERASVQLLPSSDGGSVRARVRF